MENNTGVEKENVFWTNREKRIPGNNPKGVTAVMADSGENTLKEMRTHRAPTSNLIRALARGELKWPK